METLSTKLFQLIGTVLVLMTCTPSFGQEVYTLDKVIQQTIEKYPIFESRSLEIERSKNMELQAKMQYLPNLNAYMSHGYNWGQSIDPFTNAFASTRVRTNRFALSSDVELFKGFERYFNLQGTELSIQQAELQLIVEKKKIIRDIASTYLELMMVWEEQKIDSLGLELLNQQTDIIIRRTKAGNASYSDTVSIHTEKLAVQSRMLIAQQNVRRLENKLKQFMGLAPQKEVQFVDQLLDVSVSLEVEQLSTVELENARINVEREKIAEKLIQSSAYPYLYFNYSTGTGYSGNSIQFNPDGTTSVTPFFNQLDQNFYQSLTFNLSIPIFNRMSVKGDVKNQQIKIEQAELELKNLQQTTEYEYFELKQTYLDKLTNVNLSSRIEESAKMNFELETKKFEKGLINFYQLSEAQNRFLQRKSEKNKATFESYLSRLLIAVYLEEIGIN